MCYILSPRLIEAGDERILLINSDGRVDKYREVESIFTENVSYPVQSIDLNEKGGNPKTIERLITDRRTVLIYTVGTKAYMAAKDYVGRKPIVFSSVLNWLRLPLTENTYGISNELYAEMQIMLFRYIFPDIQKIGVLYSPMYTSQWFWNTKVQAESMDVEIMGRYVDKQQDAVKELHLLLEKIDAFWLISDPLIMADKKVLLNILKICHANQVPIFSYHDIFAKYGAVLTVSVDNPTIARQAAGIAMELISGKTPADRIQYPAGSHITLNLKVIKSYHLKYYEPALDSVNQIIE